MPAPALLLSVIPMAAPATLPGTPGESDLLRLWDQYIEGVGLGEDTDYEDWVEQAARLQAALRATPSVHLTLDGKTATSLVTGDQAPLVDLMDLPRYGHDRTHVGLPLLPTDEAAERHYRLRAFADLAGREIRIAGHDSEAPRSELADAVLDLHARGIRRIVVKVVARAKYAIDDLTLPATLTYDQARHLLASELGWTLVHLDGIPGAFLVQEHVPMQYEYRLFVVGEPVTGAGCVEEHTPLNNRERFDPQVQEWRGRTVVHEDPDVVADLVAFGRDAVDRLRAEDPRLTSFVLDVAIGANGPLIVECNQLRNSGLYASQPREVVAALLT